jgi:tetratricopeptide (TPR) repeat protein
MINKIKLCLLLCLLWQGVANAQKSYEATGDIKVAKQFFLFGDYVTALKEFQYLYALDSNNPEYIYPLGICYLNTNIDKRKSIPFLEKVVAQKDFDYEAMYQLGMAYMVTYRFDEAIECFEKFKTLSAKDGDKNYIPVGRCIEMCENAVELMKNPVNVAFENLGARINSPFPDYSPFINKNETVMYYASKRPGNIGGLLDYDGYYTADVLQSENKYGEWAKAKRLAPTLNTPLVEECAGMSSDGSQLFVFVDNLNAKMQMQVSTKKGKSFLELKPMGLNINAPNDGANAITITGDKKIVFFSSAKDGGQGGSDIYMSKLLPTGQWGPAENLGKGINTQYDEDFPYLAPDGKTFYFASAGFNSMGGLDIFKCEWNRKENTFTEPVNIGYPINTPEDNTTICFSGSGRYAYISTLRNEDTYGNLDIYRVIFRDVKAGYTTVKAILTEKDSVNIYSVFRKEIQKGIDTLSRNTDSLYLTTHKLPDAALQAYKTILAEARQKLINGPDVSIQVQDAISLKPEGIYKPNRETGKFIVILSPGKYNITINCEGFQEFKETFTIEDREMPVKEMARSFLLTSK